MRSKKKVACVFVLFLCAAIMEGCRYSEPVKEVSVMMEDDETEGSAEVAKEPEESEDSEVIVTEPEIVEDEPEISEVTEGESSEITVVEPEEITMDKLQEIAGEQQWTPAEFNGSFEAENPCTFAYDRLSEAEKIWYREINEVLAYRSDEGVNLSQRGFDMGLGEKDLEKIYNCVLMDHPEYFYVEGFEYTRYSVGEKVVGLKAGGKYFLSNEECIRRKAEIEEVVSAVLAQAPVQDDYEKIKYVYEYIVLQTEYRSDAPENQNIYSVFVGKESVCHGYSKAVQYLLNRLGVEATIVYGVVMTGEAHSWNLVRSKDAYYYVDATWGDASYTSKEEDSTIQNVPDINYDYLCLNSEQIGKTHMANPIVELPDCVAISDNYYIREGNYFESYNEEQVKREIDEILAAGKEEVIFKCASLSVYEQIRMELVTNQRIFEYLPSGNNTIVYVESEEQLTLTFWVTK